MLIKNVPNNGGLSFLFLLFFGENAASIILQPLILLSFNIDIKSADGHIWEITDAGRMQSSKMLKGKFTISVTPVLMQSGCILKE